MGDGSTTVATRQPPARPRPAVLATLVWIDSRQAYVIRWSQGTAKVRRYESDVPVHRHSTGSDGSAPQDEVEGRRLEHLARFVDSIADLIPAGDDLFVIGPGTVHEQLAQKVQLADGRTRRSRQLACHNAGPMTERQMVAELRAAIGAEAPRKHARRRADRRDRIDRS